MGGSTNALGVGPIFTEGFFTSGGQWTVNLDETRTNNINFSGDIAATTGLYSTGYVRIGEVTCTGNQDGFGFSSIPQTYTHLKLMIFGTQVVVPAGTYDDIQLTVNSSGNGYNKIVWYQNGGAVPSFSNGISEDFFEIGPLGTATDNSDSNYVYGGIIIVDIPFYTNTTFYKNIMVNNGFYNVGSGNNRMTYGFSNWEDTSAISSMFLATNVVGNFFKDGTIANLYGLN